jgi:signal transduction histidine kinase
MRLVAGFMLVLTIVLASILFGASAFLKSRVIAAKEQELIRKGSDIAERISNARKINPSDARLNLILNELDTYLDARIWILDASRRPVEMSIGRTGPGMGMGMGKGLGMGRMGPGRMKGTIPPSVDMEIPPASPLRALLNSLDPVYRGEVLSQVIDHPIYEEQMVVVGVPILRADGKVDGAVLLNAPVAAVQDFLSHIYLFAGIGALIGLLVSFAVVRLFTRSLVQPLRAMQDTAAAIATGDYSARVEISSQDEIGELGRSINGLASDLGDYMLEVGKTEKLRRDFIANVSHELRTPLTVIRGYIEAMIDGIIHQPEQVSQCQNLIKTEMIRLERLIQDLLTLSRLQSDKIAGELSPIQLSAVAKHVLTLIEPLAEAKKVSLTNQIAENLPPVSGNRDRLIQLLLIFLDNAVKHSPVGASVRLTLDQNAPDRIRCVIQDTGPGISPEDLPFIWERFYKADKAHQRDSGGSGLGLAIARQIIRLHNAQVSIDSRLGEGTRIELDFPLNS